MSFLNLPIDGDVNKRRDHRVAQLSEEEVNALFAGVIGLRGVSGIAWSQYTPYFNDGEPCTFSTSEPYISFEGVEVPEEDYYADYGWMEDDAEENNRYWLSSYCSTFKRIVGSREHKWVDGNSQYTDVIVEPVLYYPIMALFKALGSGACNEVLLDKFGDHAIVIIDIAAGKVIVNEYDHD